MRTIGNVGEELGFSLRSLIRAHLAWTVSITEQGEENSITDACLDSVLELDRICVELREYDGAPMAIAVQLYPDSRPWVVVFLHDHQGYERAQVYKLGAVLPGKVDA